MLEAPVSYSKFALKSAFMAWICGFVLSLLVLMEFKYETDQSVALPSAYNEIAFWYVFGSGMLVVAALFVLMIILWDE